METVKEQESEEHEDDSEEEDGEQECVEIPNNEETFFSIRSNFLKEFNTEKMTQDKEPADITKHVDKHCMIDVRDIIIEDQYWKYQFEIKL